MTQVDPTAETTATQEDPKWLTPGVRGIGLASFLADAGHEVPMSLFPSLLITTLGASAAVLGLVEGLADGLAGLARLAGGPLADDVAMRRRTAVGGYTSTAILSALIGVATAVWQVALLRMADWASRGLRVPARNALLADMVPPKVYGRAYGFERMMDNLGAIAGPLLALSMVTLVGVRTAILLSVIPGLLAALAILSAIQHIPRARSREYVPLRLRVRPILRGQLGQLLAGVSFFEVGHIAATLLILRVTQQLTPSLGLQAATQAALWCYTAYNVAATLASVPAGRASDQRGATLVLSVGVALFLLAYLGFAVPAPNLWVLAGGFATAGLGIGCVETSQHAAVATLAPTKLRGPPLVCSLPCGAPAIVSPAPLRACSRAPFRQRLPFCIWRSGHSLPCLSSSDSRFVPLPPLLTAKRGGRKTMTQSRLFTSLRQTYPPAMQRDQCTHSLNDPQWPGESLPSIQGRGGTGSGEHQHLEGERVVPELRCAT